MQSDLYTLRREAEFLASGEAAFQTGVKTLQTSGRAEEAEVLPPREGEVSSSSSSLSIEEEEEDLRLDEELAALRSRIAAARDRRSRSYLRRTEIAKELLRAQQLQDALSDRINLLTFEHHMLQEYRDSVSNESTRVAVKLQKLTQVNAINDAFHIWYIGPFGTINNFRLGTLPTKPIEWVEINAALGQAVLAVSVVASKANFEFSKYTLSPLGSFPKIYKVEDKRTPLSLFTDGSFSLFPKRNFNVALIGFLTCVQELGDFTKSQDPTLALPYAINIPEGKIHDQVITLGTDDETWTRALKYLLTDVKWLIAWAAKHRGHNLLLKTSASNAAPGRALHY